MAGAYNSADIPMREWKWTQAEKAVARRAFELALRRELESVVREAKERVARIEEASELWDLEDWLRKRRRRIDDTFDYRYSVLPLVFAGLLHNRQIGEDDLQGLAPDKVDVIRHIAES